MQNNLWNWNQRYLQQDTANSG